MKVPPRERVFSLSLFGLVGAILIETAAVRLKRGPRILRVPHSNHSGTTTPGYDLERFNPVALRLFAMWLIYEFPYTDIALHIRGGSSHGEPKGISDRRGVF
jgi:hypothetical protein